MPSVHCQELHQKIKTHIGQVMHEMNGTHEGDPTGRQFLCIRDTQENPGVPPDGRQCTCANPVQGTLRNVPSLCWDMHAKNRLNERP